MVTNDRADAYIEQCGGFLNPPHEKQNDKDDQNDTDEPNATMTIPVSIAAEAAAESTEQEDYENDNEDQSSETVISFPSRCEGIKRRAPRTSSCDQHRFRRAAPLTDFMPVQVCEL